MNTLAVKKDHNPVIIDVREPAEYADLHLYGSVNIPSTAFSIADYEQFRGRPIFLVCNTGRRVKKVKQSLHEAGFTNLHEHPVQMQAYVEGVSANHGIEGAWTVDRQFRLALGILLLVSLAGMYVATPETIVVAGIIAIGLTFTSIIDRCYFKMLIARMPWNQKRMGERLSMAA